MSKQCSNCNLWLNPPNGSPCKLDETDEVGVVVRGFKLSSDNLHYYCDNFERKTESPKLT